MSAMVPAPAMVTYLLVGLGSALGGALRWQLALVLGTGSDWPWATLLANASGSLLIGLYAALAGPGGRFQAGPLQQQFVLAGFCGGYTTFSIFSFEALALGQSGLVPLALGYVLASLATWLAAVWAGFALGRALNRSQADQRPQTGTSDG
jgi:CrcB protein